MKIRFAITAAALIGASSAALAHPGHHPASFFTGFTHPLGGFDHLLAMLAVGVYAARQRDASRWMLPAGFMLAMLIGAVMGAAGAELPGMEAGIAASVLVFGLLIALAARLPLAAGLSLTTAFALFHGNAHHAEMGEATLMAYAAGFLLATALLHAAGYAIARWMPETPLGRAVQRAAGTLVAGAGALMLAA